MHIMYKKAKTYKRFLKMCVIGWNERPLNQNDNKAYVRKAKLEKRTYKFFRFIVGRYI